MRKVNRTSPALRKLILNFLLVAFILLSVRGIFALLCRSSAFRVTEIKILGNYPVDNSITESVQNKSIFKVNLEELSNRIIAQHPELLSVEVRKYFPGRITINLKRRQPFISIEQRKYPHGQLFVDEQGFVLSRANFKSSKVFPKVIGINDSVSEIKPGEMSNSIQLNRAIALYKEISLQENADYKVTEINVTNYKNISFFIDRGMEIKIGAGDFRDRLNLLNRTLSEIKTNEYQPKYIDLRFGDPIIGTR